MVYTKGDYRAARAYEKALQNTSSAYSSSANEGKISKSVHAFGHTWIGIRVDYARAAFKASEGALEQSFIGVVNAVLAATVEIFNPDSRKAAVSNFASVLKNTWVLFKSLVGVVCPSLAKISEGYLPNHLKTENVKAQKP